VRLLATLSVLALVLALAACGGDGGGGDIELTEADSGSTIEASVGDEITVSLAANPTTGYSWNPLQPRAPDVVALTDREYEAESDAIGAGGTEELTYEAVAAGQATIELGYFQPWEPGNVGNTFTVTVRVS
jgi:inhibitor of cysteine peptidase